MDVLNAIQARSSKRAFLERPVPREVVQEVLAAAGRAPSALNLQPWEFTVVAGEERPRLSRALTRAWVERQIGCGPGFSGTFPEKIRARQSSSVVGLAELLQTDAAGAADFVNQGSLNFYGAPAAVIITKEKFFPEHYLTSAGIMIGYLLLAAEAKGLATCPIGLINQYAEVVLDFINLEDRDLILGVALGYPDPKAPVNRLQTPREPIADLVRWYG